MSRSDTVAFIAGLDSPRAAALGELCGIIRTVDPRIEESINWNAPSFSVSEHFATTGLTPDGGIRLVLHTGAKKPEVEKCVVIEGDAGLLSWRGSDRALVTFAGLDDVLAHRDVLRSILSQWIAQTQ